MTTSEKYRKTAAALRMRQTSRPPALVFAWALQAANPSGFKEFKKEEKGVKGPNNRKVKRAARDEMPDKEGGGLKIHKKNQG
eukprot:1152728-Prorocentrum_minimum.AAC.1